MSPFFFSVLREPLLLSDSRLHLFLQSDLSITRMERCALGKTRYTVGEAIQRSSSGFISRLEDKGCDSDSERYEFGWIGLHYKGLKCDHTPLQVKVLCLKWDFSKSIKNHKSWKL